MKNKMLKLDADTVYAALWILFSSIFIFEVPGFVFWAPTLLFLTFIIYTIWKKIPLRLSFSVAVLFLFGVAYVYFTYDPEQSVYYQYYIFLHALFMFIIGFNFFNSNKSFDERFETLKQYILIVSLFYILYCCITYGYYLTHIGSAPAADRKYWSIWYIGSTTKAATGFSASMMFAVAWGIYSLFFTNKRWERILGVGLVVFCFAFNVITKTRLLVFLVPILLAGTFFVWLIYRKKKKALALALLSVFVLFIVSALLVYHFKKDMLKELFAGSVLSRFMELGFRSTRWKYIWNVVKDFSFTYLGGGVHTEQLGVPHNFWFYVYDFGGIVPFLLYALFTLILLYHFVWFVRKKSIPAEMKIFISIVMCTIFAEFMLEDLIYGLPSYVHLSHFIFGIFSGLSMKKENINTAV